MNILITGTRKGIGRYLAQYYLGQGHNVVGVSRTQTDLVSVSYTHLTLDVSNDAAIHEMSGEIRKKFASIDVLINNAGIGSMNHFLLTPTQTAKNIMEVNYLGTFVMCREFSRLLRKAEHPRIINFTTVARPLNLPGEAAYIASKAAVESLTRILAKELSQYNITVNAIGPTPIKTDLIANVPNEKLRTILAKQTIKRFGEYTDISNVTDFLIRPESDFITGQIIYLGGVF
jgi:3-oxoacyl-[acyl-carrier protein] reductase